jgi:MoxR-like ATPase
LKLHSVEPDRSSLREKFTRVRSELAATLIERDEEIDLVLTALLAHEHVLLVGPPGCGKSLLLDSVLQSVGGTKFSVLLTKFTTPEEVIGPVSLTGLKEDRFVRVTAGKLSQAEVAFIDEVFKGSSAILNCLLKILNERMFDAGDGVARPVPLKICVGASNEWPSPESGQELGALFDRFLLRKAVTPIRTQDGRQRLLWSGSLVPRLTAAITSSELATARKETEALPWSDEAREALESVLKELVREGVRPGDRRQRKSVAVARAFAYLDGAGEVQREHLGVLADALWDDPAQAETVAQVIGRVANPTGMRINQLLLEVEQLVGPVDVRDLAGAAKTAAKLSEIDRQLGTLTGNGRLDRARAYVRDQLKKLKMASIEAV